MIMILCSGRCEQNFTLLFRESSWGLDFVSLFEEKRYKILRTRDDCHEIYSLLHKTCTQHKQA